MGQAAPRIFTNPDIEISQTSRALIYLEACLCFAPNGDVQEALDVAEQYAQDSEQSGIRRKRFAMLAAALRQEQQFRGEQ